MRRPGRRLVPVAAVGLALAEALTVLAPAAHAQTPATPSPVVPPSAPGVRVIAAQSPIIGGNGAGARERALEDAFRQAVDQSLAEMLDAATRAGQARAIKAVEARARTYVRRYRALEEGEVNGAYAVRLEVEVDEASLRRATESWGAAAGTPSAAAVAPGFLLVPNGAQNDAAAALQAALVAAGARAQLADPTVKEVAEAQRAATRATLPQVAFVTAQISVEGPVRGTGDVSATCRVAARVVSAPSGLALGEPDASPRGFGADDTAARAECLRRAAGDVAARLVAGAAGSAPGGDLRALTVEADVVEPGAVVALLKDVRAVGAVSSAELRRLVPGRIEIRARTRATAAAIAPALSRDTALALSNVEVAGDVIRLRARLRSQETP
jgi:hypothetical protein